jgi:hypothetical protein
VYFKYLRNKLAHRITQFFKAVVPQVFSADPKGSATNSLGIRGYILLMPTLKPTHSLIKGIMFVKNNRGTSIIGGVLISYDR